MDSPICGITTSVPGPAAAGDPISGASIAAGVVESSAGAAAVSAFAGAAAAGAAAAAPPSLMVQTTVLICTVDPSGTLISASVPAAGDGISASTLSVEISNSGSSRCTLSP